MISLGIDIGTSFIKVCLYDHVQNFSHRVTMPEKEMEIISLQTGWAEQNPQLWWSQVQQAINKLFETTCYRAEQVDCIGITYQMHGLVLVDKDQNILRNAIIWCDSRTDNESREIERILGTSYMFDHMLNVPSHLTISKLLWVKNNEPHLFSEVVAFMLPGDYIAMKLAQFCTVTPSGLSEGILWDFLSGDALDKLEELGLSEKIIPQIVPNFYDGLTVHPDIAFNFGFRDDVAITYRAGDQINNGYFMGASTDGIAVASAGTSGVIYALSKKINYDKLGRFNSFLHVDVKDKQVVSNLLCMNAMAISYRWIKDNLFVDVSSYEALNDIVQKNKSNGIVVLPFGNVSERILGNINSTASILNLNYNVHARQHILRAMFEGLLFTFRYSIAILRKQGVMINELNISCDGLFQNDYFVQKLSDLLQLPIYLIEFDGSLGAAKGAIIGKNPLLEQEVKVAKRLNEFIPQVDLEIQQLYQNWEKVVTEYVKDL